MQNQPAAAIQAGIEAIDVPFAVRFVHRLRFTRDAFDPANRTVAEVLAAQATAPPRAVVVLDGGMAEAWPGLDARIVDYAAAHGVELGAPPLVVPGGEAVKNDRAVTDRVVRLVHEAGICRQSYVIAVGGGAVLDAVGFAAAIAHRGVRLVRLPTTTLSQDDGGIGVKNGINTFGKKNFTGAFACPWAVIDDFDFLSTLDDRDHRAGFSEAVKVALLRDADFFHRIAADAERLAARDEAATEAAVRRSAELHLRHITDGGDPFELTTSRPLDFGHWSAHKLEQMTGFELRHGEAVAIGLALDVRYAQDEGRLDGADADAIVDCLERLGFTLAHPALADVDALLEGLDEFREHLGGRLTITLLEGIGRPVDVHELDRGRVARCARRLLA